MSLLDLMWEREIEASPQDTPERAAALKKRLREAVNRVQDGDVKGLYGQRLKNGSTSCSSACRAAAVAGYRSAHISPQPTSEARRSALATVPMIGCPMT